MIRKHKITLSLIVLILLGLAATLKFTLDFVGDRVYQQKMIDQCTLEMRHIFNSYYRYEIINKLDSPLLLNWCDKIATERTPVCPVDYYDLKNIKCSYAINKNINKYTFENLPNDIILFFESDLGWNGVGDKDDVNYSNHEDCSAGVIFADGHISHLKKESINKLRWK